MTSSTKKTGNEAVSDIDPGGTRPAPSAKDDGEATEVEHKVETADRNKMPGPGKPRS